MTIIRVRGFKIFPDRHGHLRCYHRKTGIPIDLKKTPIGSPGFIAECARIDALASVKAIDAPGTLGLLICDYRKAPLFHDLAPRTRADYQKVFDYLRPIADTLLMHFDRPLVVRIRDKAAASRGRRFANYVKAVLSLLFSWGRERGWLDGNPASGIKNIRRQRGAPEANRPWSDEELNVVLDAAPDHMRPAIALMMFTGLGPKDALTLPRNFANGGEISTRRAKTGEPVFWPMPAPLAAILAAAPSHLATTLCASSKGRPWSLSGFSTSWRTLRLRLEKEGRIGPGLTPYGHAGRHPAGERVQRAHDRRRARAKDDRNGATLLQGRRSQVEDARRREGIRLGIVPAEKGRLSRLSVGRAPLG